MNSPTERDLKQPLIETAVPVGELDVEHHRDERELAEFAEYAPYADFEADEEQEPEAALKRCCDVVMSAMLPLLLAFQFGTCFYFESDAVSGLQWNVCNVAIVLFWVSSCLYRRTLEDLNISTSIVMLAPEIVTNISLGLVCFSAATTAFLTLVVGMLLMSLAVVVGTLHLLSQTEKEECKVLGVDMLL